MRKSLIILLVGLCLVGLVGKLWAAGTPAGTVIYNWALMNYTDRNGINSYTAYSDTVKIVIQFAAGVIINPDTLYQDGYPETKVFYSHYVKNIGNGADQFNLNAVSAHGWATEIYRDANGNGIVDNADTLGGSYTTTDTVAADDSVWIFAMVYIPGDAIWGDVDEMVVTATSATDGGISDSAFDFTTVVGPNLDLVKSADPSSPAEVVPYDTIVYTITMTNSDSSISRNATQIKLVDARPLSVTYIDTTVFPANWKVEYFVGASWVSVFNADADSIRFSFISPSIDSLAPGASEAFQFLVIVNDCVTDTLIVDTAFVYYEDGVGPHLYADTSNEVTTGLVQSGVALAPDSASSNGTAGDTLDFNFTVTNTGEQADSFALSFAAFPDSWTGYEIYLDDDCNDVLDPAEETAGTITQTPLIAATEFVCLIVRIVVPDTASESDSTRLVAISFTDSCATDTSFIKVNIVQPLIVLNMHVNAIGTDSIGAVPGDTATYIIEFNNIGDAEADSITLVDSLDTNTVIVVTSIDMPVVPAGLTWPADFTVDWWDGGAWQAWPPGVPEDVMAIRIRETNPAARLGIGTGGRFEFKIVIK
ncbi:hypothetical protein JXI42_06150 [bacterium]|nr:hypothetical protein [bacterium]